MLSNKIIKFMLLWLVLVVQISFQKIYAQENQLLIKNTEAAYPFLLYLPADSILKNNPPIILYLHGQSQSGSNLNLLRNYGILDAIERDKKIQAIVAMPQVPLKQSWDPDKIITVLNYVQKNYTTDLERVYVLGMSLGGYGTLHFAGKYPERVTAAVALCGGGKVSDACNLSKTVLWIQHGTSDKAVPYTESTKIFSAIKKCNPNSNLFLTLYPGGDHGILSRIFYKDTLYNWMFSYRKINQDSVAIKISGNTNCIHPDSSYTPPFSLDLNGVKRKTHIFTNIPSGSNSSRNRSSVSNKGDISYYTIKKGDTLSSIAKKHRTTVARIKKNNNLKTDFIKAGNRLLIK